VSGAPGRPLDLSIVVPTYNERERIAALIERVLAVFADAGLAGEVIVVDDNSPDGTGAIVDEFAARHARVAVVHRPAKLGLGSAVMAGFERADAPVLGVIDADLSHPPDALPRLWRALMSSGADVVVGSRYVPGGRAEGWSFGRLFMSRFACVLARPLTPVRDASSGFFLIRRELIRGVEIKAAGFKICLELLIRSPVRSVVEVPYVFHDRAAGQSKMSVREAKGYFRQLWQLAWVKSRSGASPTYTVWQDPR
jgi:dolichol-phosphate mannosyltransferase